MILASRGSLTLRLALLGGLLATGPLLGQKFPPSGNYFTRSVPAASVHGVNATFFQTQITLFNANTSLSRDVTISYFCSVGPCRGSDLPTVPVLLAPRETRVLENVVANAVRCPGICRLPYRRLESELPLDAGCPRVFEDVHAGRDFGGTYGFIAAGVEKWWSGHVLFVGVAGSGGDPGSGFRTNVSLGSASESPTATLTLFDSRGRVLGAPLTVSVGAGVQINDVFKAVGAGDVVTSAATLLIDSSGLVELVRDGHRQSVGR